MSEIKKGYSFDLGATLGVLTDVATVGLGVADKAVTTPHGTAVDTVCNTIGLDPLIAGGAKLVMGAVMQDPSLLADGALQYTAEAMQRMPAVTEVFEGSLKVGVDENGRLGYDLDWKLDDGVITADPDSFRFDYHAVVDSFFKVASNGLPPKRKLFDGANKAIPQKISSNNEQAKNATPVQGTPAEPHAPAPAGTTQPGRPGDPVDAGSGLSSSSSASTSLEHEYLRSLETLEHNWPELEKNWFTVHNMNGEMNDHELAQIAQKHGNEAVRRAAQFLLDNPDYKKRLFQNNGDTSNASRQEVKAEIFEMNQKVKYGELGGVQQMSGGAPQQSHGITMDGQNVTKGAGNKPGKPAESAPPQPAPGYTPTTPHPTPMWGVLDDKTLSVEERIMFLLQAILEDTDDEMMDLGKKVEEQRKARADAIAAGADPSKIGGFDTELDRLTNRLQSLMEKRKRMFELRSNMSNKFHEMAKTAIQNMGRA